MRWTLLFFFNDTATTEIYTLSLHDALPIWVYSLQQALACVTVIVWTIRQAYTQIRHLDFSHMARMAHRRSLIRTLLDRKSTRLNSSHANISYAVFCLKKKQTPHSSLLSIRS